MRVGVVGATGLVGTEMLRLLEERNFPVDELRAYASPRSEGRKLPFADGEVVVRGARATAASTASTSWSSTSTTRSRSSGRRGPRQPARASSTSRPRSAWTPTCPLVIAEVNPDDVRDMPKGIVVVPELHDDGPVTALAPLHRAAGIDRMVVSTYQSVSGAGQPGLHELDEQWTKVAGRSRRAAPRRARSTRRSSRARCGPSRSPAT